MKAPGRKLNSKTLNSVDGLSRRGISARKLARLWRWRYGINVDRLFASDEIRLEPVPPYYYYRFSSSIPGDAEFYSTLMRRMGYDHAEKPEFKRAVLEITPGDKVLDVGCGTGNFAAECPGAYKGIDTNPTAIEDGRRQGRNVHLSLLEDEMPGYYDVVTVFQVIEHVDDPGAFIGACIACLRPGGKIIVSTPNMNGVVGYLANNLLNYPPHHMTWWSASSLEMLIADSGCDPSDIWEEPLRRCHISDVLTALFWPRTERHLTPQIRYRVVRLALRFASVFAAKEWEEIPFIKGHAMAVVGVKRMS